MGAIIDKELEKYYEARLEMFSSKGWKDLIEDITKIQEQSGDIHNIANSDQLYFRKGELSILEWLKSLEELSRRTYDNLLEEVE